MTPREREAATVQHYTALLSVEISEAQTLVNMSRWEVRQDVCMVMDGQEKVACRAGGWTSRRKQKRREDQGKDEAPAVAAVAMGALPTAVALAHHTVVIVGGSPAVILPQQCVQPLNLFRLHTIETSLFVKLGFAW